MSQILENKVAIITGASSGIGRGLSVGFAKHGADIVIIGRNQENMDETKRMVEEQGRNAIAVSADITNHKDCVEAVNKGIEKFGKIDILVNNAGYSRLYPMKSQKLTVEIIDSILKTNILGTYYFSHAIVNHMIENGGGTILNTGSLAIYNPLPGWVAYSMSKSSLVGFTECLAAELKPYKINVNTIMPRMVRTPMLKGMKEEQIDAMKPLNAEDLVDYYAFYASKAGKKATGQMVNVDLVLEVLKLAKERPEGQETGWKEIAEKAMRTEDFKIVKKYRKLIDFMLK